MHYLMRFCALIMLDDFINDQEVWRSLCLCLQDGQAMLWDLNEGKHLYTLDGGDTINALCFSPNRYWLCAATGPSIKIWVWWWAFYPNWDLCLYFHIKTCSSQDGVVSLFLPDISLLGFNNTCSLWPLCCWTGLSVSICHYYIGIIHWKTSGLVMSIHHDWKSLQYMLHLKWTKMAFVNGKFNSFWWISSIDSIEQFICICT